MDAFEGHFWLSQYPSYDGASPSPDLILCPAFLLIPPESLLLLAVSAPTPTLDGPLPLTRALDHSVMGTHINLNFKNNRKNMTETTHTTS